MRYWKGSIALSPTQDYPLLQQVLRSNFITHRQLYDLLRLDHHATSRNAFNNRVRRLVKYQYLVRDEIVLRRDGYVYSISDIGAAELIGLGEYYTGPTRHPKDGQLPRGMYLVPNYDLISFLVGCFATLRRPIYFGLARDFLDKLFDMPLRGARPGAMTTLRNVLR